MLCRWRQPSARSLTHRWDEHYRDERDAAFLYRALATVEPTAERRELFEKLAAVEDRHALRWEELFRGRRASAARAYTGVQNTRAGVDGARRSGPR